MVSLFLLFVATQAVLEDLVTWQNVEKFTCASYQCASNTNDWEADVCVNRTSALTYELRACNDDKQCQFNQFVDINEGNYCITQQNSVARVGNGMTCDNGLTKRCSHGTCIENICQGSKLNEPCYSTDDCNPKLRCIEATCVPILPSGSTGCIDDFDCQSSTCINFHTHQADGTCVDYLSQPVGTTISQCSDSTSYQCESGQCNDADRQSPVCIEAWVNRNGYDTPCLDSAYCIAKTADGGYVSESCRCGYNDKGDSYCDVFQGDEPAIQERRSMLQWIKAGGMDLCNSNDRYQTACNEQAGAVGISYIRSKLAAQYNYKLLGNNACVQNTLNDFYWSLSATVIAISLLIFSF